MVPNALPKWFKKCAQTITNKVGWVPGGGGLDAGEGRGTTLRTACPPEGTMQLDYNLVTVPLAPAMLYKVVELFVELQRGGGI